LFGLRARKFGPGPKYDRISDEKSVAELFSRIQQVYGRLDVLFNNAGTRARKAKLPLDVNILSLTVMATKMPFVGRG
jgi:NAD(P)-dependent dehydrogenase (short-subunit alcohol dehydrogenase family)